MSIYILRSRINNILRLNSGFEGVDDVENITVAGSNSKSRLAMTATASNENSNVPKLNIPSTPLMNGYVSQDSDGQTYTLPKRSQKGVSKPNKAAKRPCMLNILAIKRNKTKTGTK